MGGENPLTTHKVYAYLTPSTSRSDWAYEFAVVTQADDYKISVLIKEGVLIYWKVVSVYINIRVLFWPEISALRVILNFDNEHMRSPPPPSVPVSAPPTGTAG